MDPSCSALATSSGGAASRSSRRRPLSGTTPTATTQSADVASPTRRHLPCRPAHRCPRGIQLLLSHGDRRGARDRLSGAAATLPCTDHVRGIAPARRQVGQLPMRCVLRVAVKRAPGHRPTWCVFGRLHLAEDSRHRYLARSGGSRGRVALIVESRSPARSPARATRRTASVSGQVTQVPLTERRRPSSPPASLRPSPEVVSPDGCNRGRAVNGNGHRVILASLEVRNRRHERTPRWPRTGWRCSRCCARRPRTATHTALNLSRASPAVWSVIAEPVHGVPASRWCWC